MSAFGSTDHLDAHLDAIARAGLAVSHARFVMAPASPDPLESTACTAGALVDSEEPRRRDELMATLRPFSTAHGGPFLPSQLTLIVPPLLARTLRAELQDAVRDTWNPHGAFTGVVDAEGIPLRHEDPFLWKDHAFGHIAHRGGGIQHLPVRASKSHRSRAQDRRRRGTITPPGRHPVPGPFMDLTPNRQTQRIEQGRAAYVLTTRHLQQTAHGVIRCTLKAWSWCEVAIW